MGSPSVFGAYETCSSSWKPGLNRSVELLVARIEQVSSSWKPGLNRSVELLVARIEQVSSTWRARLESVCRAAGSQGGTRFFRLESQARRCRGFSVGAAWCWVVYLSRAWHTVFFTMMHTFLPRNVQHFFSSFSIHFFRYPIPRLALLRRKLGRTSCPISEPEGATSSRRPVGDEKAEQIQHRSKRTTTAMLLFIISSTS